MLMDMQKKIITFKTNVNTTRFTYNWLRYTLCVSRVSYVSNFGQVIHDTDSRLVLTTKKKKTENENQKRLVKSKSLMAW